MFACWSCPSILSTIPNFSAGDVPYGTAIAAAASLVGTLLPYCTRVDHGRGNRHRSILVFVDSDFPRRFRHYCVYVRRALGAAVTVLFSLHSYSDSDHHQL